MNFEKQYFKKAESEKIGMDKTQYLEPSKAKEQKIAEEMEKKFAEYAKKSKQENSEEEISKEKQEIKEKIVRLKRSLERNIKDTEKLQKRYPNNELPVFIKLKEEENKLKELLLESEEKLKKE